MAREINDIHNGILSSIAANEVLAAKLTSPSGTSIYRLFAYIVAVAIWLLETLFDQHKKEVDEILANQKAGTLSWYRTMALRFQSGFDLVNDHDYFDNEGATDAEIEASKIVKYSAVNEAEESSRVIIKIAGETSGVLAPIDQEKKSAFDAYINEIRFAGVEYTVINYLPDRLYLTIQIKRDALVLDANGVRISSGSSRPVNDAIKEYMKELPFNGELRLSHLVDKLQLIEGVMDATIINAASSWLDPSTNGYGTTVPINIATVPVSGYFEVVNFDDINYVV